VPFVQVSSGSDDEEVFARGETNRADSSAVTINDRFQKPGHLARVDVGERVTEFAGDICPTTAQRESDVVTHYAGGAGNGFCGRGSEAAIPG
jgi:hypothetical protein